MSYVGGGWNFQLAQGFFVLPNVFLTTTCFCSLVCVQYYMEGEVVWNLLLSCIYTESKLKNKNWGRPGNEAIFPAVCFISSCFKFTLAHQVHNIPSLIPRIPHSGAQTLKLCRCGELASFPGSPRTRICIAWRACMVPFVRKHDVIKIGQKPKGNVLRVVQPTTLQHSVCMIFDAR